MKTYGNTGQVVSNITRTTNLEGDKNVTGTLVYTHTGTYQEVIRGIPALGSQSTYFPAECVLQTTQLANDAGGVWKVTLTYAPQTAKHYDVISPRKRDYNLQTSNGQTSILLHPKFKDVSGYTKSLCKMFIEGTPRTKVMKPPSIESENGYVPDMTADDTTLGALLDAEQGDDDTTPEYNLIKLINEGVKNYVTPKVTWDCTEYLATIPTETKVGKIDTPKGPCPSFPNQNWLLTTFKVKKSYNSAYWTVDRSWTLSDQGAEWNAYLYGNG